MVASGRDRCSLLAHHFQTQTSNARRLDYCVWLEVSSTSASSAGTTHQTLREGDEMGRVRSKWRLPHPGGSVCSRLSLVLFAFVSLGDARHCRPTVGPLSAHCRPTVGPLSCSGPFLWQATRQRPCRTSQSTRASCKCQGRRFGVSPSRGGRAVFKSLGLRCLSRWRRLF
jgi:hypothetical protein